MLFPRRSICQRLHRADASAPETGADRGTGYRPA